MCFFFCVKHDNIDDDVVVVSATINMNAQNKKTKHFNQIHMGQMP